MSADGNPSSGFLLDGLRLDEVKSFGSRDAEDEARDGDDDDEGHREDGVSRAEGRQRLRVIGLCLKLCLLNAYRR